MSARFQPNYVDLRVAYPTPAEGEPSPAGWWRQVGWNIDLMWSSMRIAGTTGHAGGWEQTPDWIGVDPKADDYNRVAYIQIGQIVYLFAQVVCDGLSTENGLNPPIDAAPSLLPMPCGHGVYQGANGEHLFVPMMGVDGRVIFHATTPDSGLFREGTPVTQAADDLLHLTLKYRTQNPGEGRLSGLTHAPEHQYPILTS